MLVRAARIIRIYAKLQLLHLRTHLEYESDFWIGILGVMIKHSVSFIFILTIFRFVPEIHGWRQWEVAFLYALYVIPPGLVELFYDGQWRLPQLVNLGEFDILLLRPISPALQVITQLSSIHGLGSVILGGIILIQSSLQLNITWGPEKYLFLLITLVNSTFILGSLTFTTNCLVFWESSPNPAFPVLVQQMTELAKYPNTIYPSWLRTLTIWVVPLSFVSYFPGLILLEKQAPLSWLGYATPLSGLIVLAVAGLVWRLSLARYQGTGS